MNHGRNTADIGMDVHLNQHDRTGSAHSQTNIIMKKSLKPFGAGVAGWIVGLMVLFGLAWPLSSPDTVSNAIIWMLEHWWAAYSLGLVALLAKALSAKIPPLTSLLAYILPIAVMMLLALVFVWIYPNSGFREDLLSYIPVSVVFYVMSWMWISLRKQAEPCLLRATAPPLFGGIIILALVAVPVFTSNAFIYRNAFTLDVLEVQRPENALVAKCVLEIHKAGDYEFRSPSTYYFEMIYPEMTEDGAMPQSTVVWGEAGKPAAGAAGKYPLEIRWSHIPKSEMMATTEIMNHAVPIVLEAHSSGNPAEVLYTLTGWEPEKNTSQ